MSERSGRPLVSVLVCVYNGERFLRTTLDSVLAQTFADFEIIVVDDGSTDASAAILSRCGDRRLQVVRQENQGAATALNTGLRTAAGTHVAFLDQDDVWKEDSLAAHVDLLERRPEIDLSFSWFQIVDQEGREIGLHSNRYRGTLDFPALLTDFVIGASSNVVARRAAVERAGGADPSFPRYYDIDLFLRVALLRPHNVAAIPRDLMLYRRHGSQITRHLDALQPEWERLLEKLRQLAPPEVARVEKRARSNMCRYFACLAYEGGEFQKGLRLLRDGFSRSPADFLTDVRNWTVWGACLCGLALPVPVHQRLERLTGLRRGRA